MPDIGRSEIKTMLAAMSIRIGDEDAAAVGRLLTGILADCRKFDEVASGEFEAFATHEEGRGDEPI